MRARDARMTGHVGLRRTQLDERQPIVERRIGLARVVDQLDRAIPHRGDRARVANRNECRQSEIRAIVPAFRDDFRSDPGGIAKRNGKRSQEGSRHQPRSLTEN